MDERQSMAASRPAVTQLFSRAVVGGVTVDLCGERDLTEAIGREAMADRQAQRRARLVFDINGHGLALAAIDPVYRHHLQLADVVHTDGQPLVFTSRWLCAQPIPERTATTDLIHAVGRMAERTGVKVYFLGAKAEVIAKAAQQYLRLYPRAQVAGFRDGYFTDAELPEVAEAINRSGADVVFVGIGKPREQAVCVAMAPMLQVSWLITAGGCFDFLAGNAPRAPQWMQGLGLEWLYRLAAEPRRLFWRYLWTNVVSSILLVFRTRWKVSQP
jgi:N-acetylglucosaminyldiphosphoundecaprenol N-acetyl-beta-D-mannosaminyltransferase